MSEYARRNLACPSHHRCPEGWHAWTGNVHGFSTRPFCELPVGHAGEHAAGIESIEHTEPGTATLVELDGSRTEVQQLMPAHRDMTWPNTLGIPDWLTETAIHALRMVRDHVYARNQTEAQLIDPTLYAAMDIVRGWRVTDYTDTEED